MHDLIDQYMAELAGYLSSLDPEERQDVLEFYREYLLDAKLYSQSQIETELGTAKQLAHKILADYSLTPAVVQEQQSQDQEAQRHFSKSQTRQSHRDLRTVWWIILGLCAVPVAFPFLAVLCGVLLFLILMVVAFVILVVTLFGTGIFLGLKTVTFLGTSYWAVGCFYVGLSLICIAGALLLLPLGIKLLRFLASSAAQAARWVGNKVFRNRYYHGGNRK